MSRSRRKHSIAGVTAAASDKRDKRDANRALRKASRQVLGTVSDASVFPVMREIRDEWDTPKEGKFFFNAAANPKRMRK
jgi:hypothetical protein